MNNTPFSVKVSAPGNIMLMGEHAVVKGYKAIACAVEKRIAVTLTGRADRQVIVHSALGSYFGSLDNLVSDSNLSFVLKAIELQKHELTHGFEIVIEANFSHTLGLGSSAAVTVATLKALSCFSGQSLTKEQHLQKSLAVVHAVQGRGSGTDLAASIYGGVIAYQMSASAEQTSNVEELPLLPEIALYYAGYKTKTAQVLAIVADKEKDFPLLYQGIYQMMGNITDNAIIAAQNRQWQHFGLLMNMYQGQMDSLGVNDAALCDMIYQLRQSDSKAPQKTNQNQGVLGAKISGSGLGDCIVVLGENTHNVQGYQKIEISIANKGVIVHDS